MKSLLEGKEGHGAETASFWEKGPKDADFDQIEAISSLLASFEIGCQGGSSLGQQRHG